MDEFFSRGPKTLGVCYHIKLEDLRVHVFAHPKIEDWMFPKIRGFKSPQNGWWKQWFQTLFFNGWFGGFPIFFWKHPDIHIVGSSVFTWRENSPHDELGDFWLKSKGWKGDLSNLGNQSKVTKNFRYLKWRFSWTLFLAILEVGFPYIGRIHTAYIGEDSSILGTWKVWWKKLAARSFGIFFQPTEKANQRKLQPVKAWWKQYGGVHTHTHTGVKMEFQKFFKMVVFCCFWGTYEKYLSCLLVGGWALLHFFRFVNP